MVKSKVSAAPADHMICNFHISGVRVADFYQNVASPIDEHHLQILVLMIFPKSCLVAAKRRANY